MAVICVKENGVSRFKFEQRYVDYQVQLEQENVTEVQGRWRNEFATPAPTRVTV
jgi:hypothetical protein